MLTATELNLLDDKDATQCLQYQENLKEQIFQAGLLIGHATTGTLNNAQSDTGVGT